MSYALKTAIRSSDDSNGEQFIQLGSDGLAAFYPYSQLLHPEPFFIDIYEPLPFLPLEKFVAFFSEEAEIWVQGNPSSPAACLVFHDFQPEHALANVDFVFDGDYPAVKSARAKTLWNTIRYTLRIHKLTRLQSFVLPFSQERMNLIESFGFCREGVLREHHFHNGKLYDVIVYAWMKKNRSN